MFAHQIADKHNAYLLSDIAHISGLISAKVRSQHMTFGESLGVGVGSLEHHSCAVLGLAACADVHTW